MEENGSLERMIAERIADDVDRMVREGVEKRLSEISFDPDEVLGYMTSKEAAKFLGIPYSTFREIAPEIPRYAITPGNIRYLRRDLSAYGEARRIGRFAAEFAEIS